MAKPKPDYKVLRKNVPEDLWPEISKLIEEWKIKRGSK